MAPEQGDGNVLFTERLSEEVRGAPAEECRQAVQFKARHSSLAGLHLGDRRTGNLQCSRNGALGQSNRFPRGPNPNG